MDFRKSIKLSHILGIIFALIANIYQEILIWNEKYFEVFIICFMVVVMICICSFIMYFVGDGKWMTMFLTITFYIVYWFIFLFIFSELFPLGVDDLGIGIIMMIMAVSNCISVVIGCILGVLVKRKKHIF